MPRKSNGCKTCKRRKVKCDATKPSCLRCVRHHHECEGYADNLIVRRSSLDFRDQTHRVTIRAQASYARRVSTTPQPSVRHALSTSSETTQAAASEKNDHPTDILSSSPMMVFLPTVRQMDHSRENRTQMLANFIHLHLPHHTSNLDRSHFAYMYLLPDIVGQHPAIPSAIDALCMYHLGMAYDDPNSVAKSRSIYGNAISRLARSLDKTSRYASTGTLAAIILLAQCELNQGHSYAWEHHIQGALRLLEQTDPLAWDTNEGRLLLQGLRYVIACQGLVKRRAIIFTRRDWQKLVTTEGSVDIWVRLMNLCSHIPRQLEETDKALASPSGPQGINHVLDRALKLRSRMLKWYAMMVRCTAPVQQISLALLDWYKATIYDTPTDYVFKFQDCRSCYLNMQYKFFMMFLSTSIIQLYDSNSIDLAQDALPTRAMMNQEAHDLAMDVARCVPTILDPANPSVGLFNGAVSIKLAGDYFFCHGLLDRAYWCSEMGFRLQESLHVPESVKLRLPDDDNWNN